MISLKKLTTKEMINRGITKYTYINPTPLVILAVLIATTIPLVNGDTLIAFLTN